jgi:hypothetical protein
MKKAAFGNSTKNFIINVVGRQHASWQGTVTLTDRKAVRATRLPATPERAAAPGANTAAANKQTIPFRRALELMRLIDSAFEEEEDESDARRQAAKPNGGQTEIENR